MSDYMTLMGAEDVRQAGGAMREAASEMQRAASSMDYSLEQHARRMGEWMDRFEEQVNRLEAIEAARSALNPPATDAKTEGIIPAPESTHAIRPA